MTRCEQCGELVKYRKDGVCLKCKPFPYLCTYCGEDDKKKFFKSKKSICKACYYSQPEKKIPLKCKRFIIREYVERYFDKGWQDLTGRFNTKEDAKSHYDKYFNNLDYIGLRFCIAEKVEGEWKIRQYLYPKEKPNLSLVRKQ